MAEQFNPADWEVVDEFNPSDWEVVEPTGLLKGTAQAVGRGIASVGVAAGDYLQDNPDVALGKAKPSLVNKAGEFISDLSQGVQDYIPRPVPGGEVKRSWFEGVESLPLSAAYAVPGIVGAVGGRVLGAGVGAVAGAPTGPGAIATGIAGSLAGGTAGAALGQAVVSRVMHASTRQATLEELDRLQAKGFLRDGVTPEEKLAAANQAAYAEWVGEAPSSIVESLIYSRLPAGKALSSLLKPGWKQFAKNMGMSAPLEVGGEAYTAQEQTKATNSLLKPEYQSDPNKAMAESVGPTLVMTGLMNVVGVGGQRLVNRSNVKALENGSAPSDKRAEAVANVARALKSSHGQGVADNFQKNAAQYLASGKGMDLKDPSLLQPDSGMQSDPRIEELRNAVLSGAATVEGLTAGRSQLVEMGLDGAEIDQMLAELDTSSIDESEWEVVDPKVYPRAEPYEQTTSAAAQAPQIDATIPDTPESAMYRQMANTAAPALPPKFQAGLESDAMLEEFGQDSAALQAGEDMKRVRNKPLALPAPPGKTYGDGFTMQAPGTPNTIIRPGERYNDDAPFRALEAQKPKAVVIDKKFKSKKMALVYLAQRRKSGKLEGLYDVYPTKDGKWQIRSGDNGTAGEIAQKQEADDIARANPLLAVVQDLQQSPISHAQLSQDYDADTIGQLSKRYPGIISKKSNRAPDEVAGLHGFSGMDEMVEALKTGPTIAETLQKHTEPADRYGNVDKMQADGLDPVFSNMPAGDLTHNDDIEVGPGSVIPADRYKVKGWEDGQIVLQDGVRVKVDPWDTLNIEGRKATGKELEGIDVPFGGKRPADIANAPPDLASENSITRDKQAASESGSATAPAYSAQQQRAGLTELAKNSKTFDSYFGMIMAWGNHDGFGFDANQPSFLEAIGAERNPESVKAALKKLYSTDGRAGRRDTRTAKKAAETGVFMDAIEREVARANDKETPNAQTDKADTVAAVAEAEPGDDVGLTEEAKRRAVELETKPDKHGDTVNPKVSKLVAALQEAGHTTTMSGDFYGDKLVYVDLGEESDGKVDESKLPAGWVLTYKHIPLTNEAVLGTPIPENQAAVSNTVKSVDARTRLARAGKEAVSPQDISAILKSFSGATPQAKAQPSQPAVQWDKAKRILDDEKNVVTAISALKYQDGSDSGEWGDDTEAYNIIMGAAREAGTTKATKEALAPLIIQRKDGRILDNGGMYDRANELFAYKPGILEGAFLRAYSAQVNKTPETYTNATGNVKKTGENDNMDRATIDWTPEQQVKIAADSIDTLRPADVFRVMESTPAEKREEMRKYITKGHAGNQRMLDELRDATEELAEPAKQASNKEIPAKQEDAAQVGPLAGSQSIKPALGPTAMNAVNYAKGRTVTKKAVDAATGRVVQLKDQDASEAIRETLEDIDGLSALKACL